MFDSDPPFAAAAFGDNNDRSLATIKDRFWYAPAKEEILTRLEQPGSHSRFRKHALCGDPCFTRVIAAAVEPISLR
jgi:hypothetical protein